MLHAYLVLARGLRHGNRAAVYDYHVVIVVLRRRFRVSACFRGVNGILLRCRHHNSAVFIERIPGGEITARLNYDLRASGGFAMRKCQSGRSSQPYDYQHYKKYYVSFPYELFHAVILA